MVKRANLFVLPMVFCLISGGVATLRDRPILAPVQKRNNFITVFNTRKGILVEVHVVLPKNKDKKPSFQYTFIKSLKPLPAKERQQLLFKTTFIPICDECLYRFPININVWSYMKIKYSVKRLYSILNPLNIFMAVHLVSEEIGAKSVLFKFWGPKRHQWFF